MKRFSYGESITGMLTEFAKYAKTADSLATIWVAPNDEPEELAKLEVITAFAKVCREMLDDLEEAVNHEKPYYSGEVPYYEDAKEVPE